jgi:hypothetical protein
MMPDYGPSKEYGRAHRKILRKLKSQVGVKEAAQFYQLESYFLSLIRMHILDAIPFIDTLHQTEAKK